MRFEAISWSPTPRRHSHGSSCSSSHCLQKCPNNMPLWRTTPSIIGVLSKSSRPDIEDALKKIARAVAASSPSSVAGVQDAPGGRHSNDQSDFRDILILPTADELTFTSERTFLRPSHCLEDPSTEPNRVSIHLDNQFRLLREDMLHEMREELQIALGKKQGKHRGFVIEGLTPLEVYCKGSEEKAKECNWALTFQCKSDLWQFKKCKDAKARKAYVKDNPRFLKHQSLTCLLIEGQVIAFPNVSYAMKLFSCRIRLSSPYVSTGSSASTPSSNFRKPRT
jgi:hypothetical protein